MENKNVLVTGGAMGLGEAFVQHLLKAGIRKCAILDFDSVTGNETAEKFKQEFGNDRVIFVKCDVSNKSDMEKAFDIVMNDFKTLDIVINNAGILDEIQWEKMLDVNVKGTVHGTNLAMKHMGKNMGKAGGMVVNISSIAAFLPLPCAHIYGTCKAAVIGLTRAWALDYHYSKTGVKAIAICPGPTKTNLIAKVFSYHSGTDVIDAILKAMPEPYIEPEDVARMLIHVLKNGDNGNIWVTEEVGKPYEISIPSYKDMKK